MIDPRLFTVERLLATMLHDSHGNRSMWRKHAEILPNHAVGQERPRCVVRFDTSFLRYSKGPQQGFFWDFYPDDMQTPELALLALLQAPVPPRACDREQFRTWVAEAEAPAPEQERGCGTCERIVDWTCGDAPCNALSRWVPRSGRKDGE